MDTPLLEVRRISKRYGPVEALTGVSFEVAKGELFGLLGPNGAGKTTLMSILACLSEPSDGEVLLSGKPLRREDLAIRREIGIGTQDLSVYGELSARENLRFFGKLYGLRGIDLDRRVDEVLDLAGLTERADQRVDTFSGGMKRRLNLGTAVIHQPRLLLLDEPTTGVDPQSRNHIFERVRQLNREGMTIIYTTHYMEEAQTLCPRIGILDHGKWIACDTLSALLQRIDGRVRIDVSRDAPLVAERLTQQSGLRVVEVTGNQLVLATNNTSRTILLLVSILREASLELVRIEIQEPTLEQVFLHLTQHTLRD